MEGEEYRGSFVERLQGLAAVNRIKAENGTESITYCRGFRDAIVAALRMLGVEVSEE